MGSHTATHPLLTGLSDAELDHELAESRRTISARLGDCRTIAYPYGQADDRVAAATAAAGYEAACTLTGAHLADEPHLRPRVNMTRSDTGRRLALKVSPAGVGLRRSTAARTVRRLRRRRDWLPDPPGCAQDDLALTLRTGGAMTLVGSPHRTCGGRRVVGRHVRAAGSSVRDFREGELLRTMMSSPVLGR